MPALCKRIAIPAALAATCATAAFAYPAASQGPATVQLTVLPSAQPGSITLPQALARTNVLPATYTVRPGDSLTSIAVRYYGRPDAWTAIYWANDREIRWANQIKAGQVLVIPAEPARIPAAPPQLAPPPPPPVKVLAAYTAAPVTAAPAQAAAASAPAGSFEACVIERESGGDPRAVNPTSGAGGIFQFMPATWQSLGYPGLPENAPVAEQYAAFAKEYAEAGPSPWSDSDGC